MGFDRLDFSRRAEAIELMDQPCGYEEFRACLVDLAKVNLATGTYRPTLSWLEQLVAARQDAGNPLHIVDVGCGYGDMLRRIHDWASQNGVTTRLTGIDLNPYSAMAAKEASTAYSSISWITGNALSYKPASQIDVVISSLFAHHLTNNEIVQFISWMEKTARRGWFINDLHRSVLSYFVFKLWAKAAHWHPFVQHDGPVSIRRSFVSADWEHLCAEAALPRQAFSIEWYRSFRLCVSRVRT